MQIPLHSDHYVYDEVFAFPCEWGNTSLHGPGFRNTMAGAFENGSGYFGLALRSNLVTGHRRQRQQHQVLRNMDVRGPPVQPQICRSDQNLNTMSGSNQQAYSQMASSPFEMNHPRNSLLLGSPDTSIDLSQQWQTHRQSTYASTHTPYGTPHLRSHQLHGINHEYNHSLAIDSPVHRERAHYACSGAQQHTSNIRTVLRQTVNPQSIAPGPKAALPRYSVSLYCPKPVGDQTHAINRRHLMYRAGRPLSPQSGFISGVSQSQLLCPSLLEDWHMVTTPAERPSAQLQFSAVQQARIIEQGCRNKLERQEMQAQEQELGKWYILSTHESLPSTPKRQRIETPHESPRKLSTEKHSTRLQGHGQDKVKTQAQAQARTTGSILPPKILNDELVTPAKMPECHTSKGVIPLQDYYRAGDAQQVSKRAPKTQSNRSIINIEEDEHTESVVQRPALTSAGSGRTSFASLDQRSSHGRTLPQLTFASNNISESLKSHESTQNGMHAIGLQSPAQVATPRENFHQTPTSDCPQTAPEPQTTSPRQQTRPKMQSPKKDRAVPKQQTLPTPPKPRRKPAERSRKTPSSPVPKSSSDYRPLVDATELDLLELRSTCKTTLRSANAKHNVTGKPQTPFRSRNNLPQGTHRSSRHFQCTCAYPFPTCYAPDDPLGCPKRIEAEQRMTEMNGRQDRCLEVRYIGSRSPQ